MILLITLAIFYLIYLIAIYVHSCKTHEDEGTFCLKMVLGGVVLFVLYVIICET